MCENTWIPASVGMTNSSNSSKPDGLTPQRRPSAFQKQLDRQAQICRDRQLKDIASKEPTFAEVRLWDIMPEAIEDYLRRRLSAGRRCHAKDGVHYPGTLKPVTVHQEFRVLRRILNVAVKQKRLNRNPCNAVGFPVSVSNTTRTPHYMTSSEQEQIEICAPSRLRHTIVIIAEMGLRPYKELMPMKKSQVDLENSLVYIDDPKTASGVGHHNAEDHMGRDAEKGRCSVFPHLSLAHTFATRLSAGGVSDHFVTLMLRQGDAQAFRPYSQAKLNMMREALARLDRQANEREGSSITPKPN